MSAEEFRVNAEEAERRSEQAVSEEERSSYQQIARGWRELLASRLVSEQRGF